MATKTNDEEANTTLTYEMLQEALESTREEPKLLPILPPNWHNSIREKPQ